MRGGQKDTAPYNFFGFSFFSIEGTETADVDSFAFFEILCYLSNDEFYDLSGFGLGEEESFGYGAGELFLGHFVTSLVC